MLSATELEHHRETAAPARAVRFSTLTRWLVVALVVNALAIDLALMLTPWTSPGETTLHEFWRFLTFDTGWDSWRPMELAWRITNDGTPDGRGLYDWLFFDEFEPKFQYAPASLLPIEAMQLVMGDTVHYKVLDLISWLSVWATAVFSALILERAFARYAPRMLHISTPDRLLRAAAIALLVVVFYPVIKSFTLGQAQTWLNALFTMIVWLWLSNRTIPAGIGTALICTVKPQLGLLLVWGALVRQWTYVAAFGVALAILGVVALALYGISLHLEYLDVLSYISARGESFHANNSVNGILNHVFQNGSNVVWVGESIAPYHAAVHAGTVISSAIIIGAALFWTARRRSDAVISLCIASLAFTMASPIAWEHHYGILPPIYAVALAAMIRWPVFGRWSLPYLAVSFLLSSKQFLFTNNFADTAALTPLQSYLFFGALMLLVALFRLHSAAAADPGFDPDRRVVPLVADRA